MYVRVFGWVVVLFEVVVVGNDVVRNPALVLMPRQSPGLDQYQSLSNTIFKSV